MPSIKSDLGFSQESLQWVVSAYAIFFGGALLLGGRLGDLLGRRRLFVAGLAVFAMSSLLCGLAWSEALVIAFRSLQGLGGALLAPAALALLMTTFAEGRERNKALGIYGAAAGSGAAVGVLLGGILTSYLSWPWISSSTCRSLVAAIALTPLLLRESRAENRAAPLRRRRRDVDHGRADAPRLCPDARNDGRLDEPARRSGCWPHLRCSCSAFIAIELRSKAPLLPLRIFRIRSLAAANVAMVIIGSATFAEFFLLTLYLQDVLHYTAVQTGVAFSGFAISVVVASNLAQAVVSRVGIRATLTTGIAASALSMAWLTRLPVDGHYFWDLFPAFVLGGLGLGFSFVPLTIASLAGVERADAGVASGLVNTSRQMGGAIGLAAMSAIAATSTANYADAHPGVGAASAAALDHGFQTTLYVLTGLLVLGAVIAGVWIKPQQSAQAQVPKVELDVLKEAA